jgi:hypothetical protein
MKALNRLLFDDSTGVASTYAHASSLEKINTAVREILPPEVHPHFVGTAWKEERLSVFFDSAAWAMHMRFHIQALQTHLREQQLIGPTTELKYKISPLESAPQSEARKPTTPSAQTLSIWQDSLDGFEKNSALRGAMERLIKRLSS